MKIYSDSAVSEFLRSVTADQSAGFLNDWNGSRSHREKIYISYDSTNKNSQAGDVEIVEYGKPKADMGFPVFNYAVGYDANNREPLFYERYPGSIVDISQLKLMLNKAEGYGYKKVGFILDRGYFSKQNIEHMDRCGYSFVIMIKGMQDLVSTLILENKGSFESKQSCDMDGYGVYGKTVKRRLYESDTRDRYFHIYHSISKEASERELNLCGYFVIVPSDKMTAKEALHIYKSRDFSEKAFRGDKTYLGDKSLRVHSNEPTSAKIFVEFVAMIIRNKLYTCLLDEMKRTGKKQNYMTVSAAVKEFEKIEMTRQTDNVYRLDHAVTAVQKKILKVFDLTEKNIEYRTAWISEELKTAKRKGGQNGKR